MTLEEFGDQHGLALEFGDSTFDDRGTPVTLCRASFRRSSVKRGVFLVGEYGVGRTRDEAIRDYGRRISGKVLVVEDGSCRRILVPVLEDRP